MLSNEPWSMLRMGLVFLTWGLVTLNYFSFSHSIHNRHRFEPPKGHGDHGGGSDPHEHEGNHGHPFDPHEHGGGPPDGHGHNQHGRGAFEFDLDNTRAFLQGLALPLLFLTLVALVWNPSTSAKGTTTKKKGLSLGNSSSNGVSKSRGEVNVKKWTIIWFVLPLFLVMLDGAIGSHMSSSQGHQMGWNLYIRICMSLMSPSGYAATWALSLFLIPVTKHSPILDWLNVTPIQALAFHRVTGWCGFWNSVLHGFLHLRHLMDVLNPGHKRVWQEQLKILLIPQSWECIGTQNPFKVFWGHQDPLSGGTEEDANQCWLALVNATGMISVIAFALLAVISLPQVRRYSYALFYRVHIPAAWIMLIMAIWHYPTCALILIPNIIYYLSFNIPVSMKQTIDAYVNRKKTDSALVEANLIQGGSVELVFATAQKDRNRHESRFAKIYCPAASPLSHPFSVFSSDDLVYADSTNDEFSPPPLTTLSILLKSTGPFTEGMTKSLFSSNTNEIDEETTIASSNLSEPLIVSSSNGSSVPPKLQFDSFYAASFDWTDQAMVYHDQLLLIAGGVGIVPFFEFLPSLRQRIVADACAAATSGTDGDSQNDDNENLLESNQVGPRQISLHWYCREVGLASYVWHRHLRHHMQKWENDPATQGRLKMHFHLTSLSPDNSSSSSSESEDGKEILSRVLNSGLQKKQIFESNLHPTQDAHFTQCRWLGLLLPGSVMLVGTVLHWWWYKQYILDEKYRHDNLVIRSHSIVFTSLLAVVLSILVEHSFLKKKEHYTNADLTLNIEYENDSNILDEHSISVNKGRPAVDCVIAGVIEADRPGVYSCGPHALMESVERAIRHKRDDCAFYREDSEM